MGGSEMRNTNITLTFTEAEESWLRPMMENYYGKKLKTKKDYKKWLGIFVSTMFNKAAYAIEHNEQYININE